jgi:crossover junction endodeoxyribonuclease RusA
MKLKGSGNKIKGPFMAKLILSPPDKRRRDLDNLVKPILDLAQSLQWIEDDSLCQDLQVKWDRTLPVGAHLYLWPISSGLPR